MEFNDYCVIILDSKNFDIEKVFKFTESEPNYLTCSNSNMVILTFVSNLTTNEIGEYLKSLTLNYFLFEINNHSSFNINDENLMLDLVNNLNLKNKTVEMGEWLSDDIDEIKIDIISNDETMDKVQLESEINEILDKGYANLTEIDLKIMSILSSKL
jgi:hypothetical protein